MRDVQWRRFHRCAVKNVFPIICDLPRSLRISSKTNSHWYVLEEIPQWFPWQYPYESDSNGKRTCLDAGFLTAKWNLFCCYCLFSHLLDQLSLCKCLYAKWCYWCWCCLCLAVTGWCHSAVGWQRSCFRGAFSKDSRGAGKCWSTHWIQHF